MKETDCVTKKPIGITFEIGKAETGWFWYFGKLKLRKMRPSLDGIDAKFGGLKLDILIGKWRRPIPRFYKPEFWSRDYVKKEQATNPWNSGKHWFIFTIPVFPGIFISLSMGGGEKQPGFYLGTKTYEVNRISQNRKIYMADRNDIILGTIAWGRPEEKGNIYICPSGSIREDLVD